MTLIGVRSSTGATISGSSSGAACRRFIGVSCTEELGMSLTRVDFKTSPPFSLASSGSDNLRLTEKKGLKEGARWGVPVGIVANEWTSLWGVLLMGIGRMVSKNPDSTEQASPDSSLLRKDPELEAGFTAVDEKLDLKDLEKCVEAATALSASGTSTR